MAQYASYSGYIGGGSGTLTSINGATGPAITIVPGTGISVGTVGNVITVTNTGSGTGTVTDVAATAPLASTGGATPDISITQANTTTDGYLSSNDWNTFNNKQDTGVGNNNTFAGFNNTGVLESVPGFNIDTTTGGMNENLVQHPNNGGGATNNNYSIGFEPLQNSPNESWNIQSIQVFMDDASSGFSQGTNGSAVQLLNLNTTHHGTGDVGGLFNITMNSDIGNGTDPITVGASGMAFGFGNIHANVNVDGSLQGYTFQVNVDAAATGTSNFSASAFEDFSNIGIPVNGYTAYNSGPNIFAITNAHSYNGVNVSPNITTLTGNASLISYGGFGSVTTMGAGSSLTGLSWSPSVTTSHGTILGALINPQIHGGDANFTGLQISPSGSVTIGDLTGISINLSNLTDGSNPQGPTGISSDSRLQINATTQLKSAQTFQIGSRLEHAFSVPPGSPVTGTDELAVNIAGDLLAQDDIANGAFGIGFNSVGFIADMGVAVGKTVDTITVFLPAAALPDPGFTTGGNVTEFHMIRTFPPLAQGGTVNITNLYGFKLDSAFGNFSAAATNAWGLYIQDPGLNNFIEGRLGIGIITPTADLHLKGVTTAAGTASLKINSGTLMTTPENGAIESDGTDLWWTDDTGTRQALNGGGGGANTALSNLTTTSIPTDLLSDNPGTRALGASGNDWGVLWASGIASSTTSDLLIQQTIPAQGLELNTINDTGATGLIRLLTGDSGTSNSGDIDLLTGAAAGAAASGSLTFATGENTGSSNSGDFSISTGNSSGSAGNSGNFVVSTGSSANGSSGAVELFSSQGQLNSGGALLSTGEALTGNSGDIEITTGTSDAGDSGPIVLTTGPAPLGTRGVIQFDGKIEHITGGVIQVTRTALTTPVTVTRENDYAVFTKLTTPGAVTVNLPAGINGTEFYIKDATGDALLNNITINRASTNTFQGGGTTDTININFGFRHYIFQGGVWYSLGSL